MAVMRKHNFVKKRIGALLTFVLLHFKKPYLLLSVTKKLNFLILLSDSNHHCLRSEGTGCQ